MNSTKDQIKHLTATDGKPLVMPLFFQIVEAEILVLVY